MTAPPLTLEQILTFLLDAPMFGALDPTELAHVVGIMQIQHARDGHAVFREGDPGDAWYVLFDGRAEVVKETETGARCIAALGPRACFGEMAILDHSPRMATVLARGDCTIFRFPRREFEGLLADGNLAAYKVVHEMAKVLCVRARHTAQQLAAALDRPEGLSVRARSVLDSQAASE
jgi:CRP/FNR family cyclic AMP-dependent transcriptional regulator